MLSRSLPCSGETWSTSDTMLGPVAVWAKEDTRGDGNGVPRFLQRGRESHCKKRVLQLRPERSERAVRRDERNQHA